MSKKLNKIQLNKLTEHNSITENEGEINTITGSPTKHGVALTSSVFLQKIQHVQ